MARKFAIGEETRVSDKANDNPARRAKINTWPAIETVGIRIHDHGHAIQRRYQLNEASQANVV